MKNDDRATSAEEKERAGELVEEDLEQANGGQFVHKDRRQWQKKEKYPTEQGEGPGTT